MLFLLVLVLELIDISEVDSMPQQVLIWVWDYFVYLSLTSIDHTLV